MAVVALEHLLHHVLQVVCALARQTLKEASVPLARQGFMTILIATVRKKIKKIIVYIAHCFSNILQLADVAALELHLHHAHQVVHVHANQISLEPNALHASLGITTIQTVIVSAMIHL